MKVSLFALMQLCLLNCFVLTKVQAQNCTFTNLRLTSQALVNDFSSTCKNVKGDIKISGADITDLTPLKNIELIDGMLTIQDNSSLTSLKGLEKLAGAQHLLIYTNNLLTDLSGLEGLKSVSGSTHIRYNGKLVNLKGLNNVTQLKTFYLTNNDLLENLTGLGNLESVTDLISINSNKKLRSLTGLTKLASVRRILIGDNEILPDLLGLEALTSVTWQMNISSNKSLASFTGLNNLTHLSEIYLSDNNLMTDMSGLESVTNVYWIVIGESQGLTSLNGLNNLSSATNMIIRTNDLLTDLTGLENLTSVGWLNVDDNAALVSLNGIGTSTDGLRTSANGRVAAMTIGGLAITNNPNLTTCAISSVCAFVSNNTATVSGNGDGCETQSAIEIACTSLPVTLAHFNAICEKQTAILQWETTAESNSSVFEIEHSLDGQTWQKVGTQTAKGESINSVNYQWVHRTPRSGLNYYRLKMIDLDGSYAHSRIANLTFSSPDLNAVFIYPNPVSEMLFVENKKDVVSLRIVNLQGKTVYETKSVPNEGLSVKKLARGLYQVHITRQSGEVQAEHVAIL
jgi:hypothetical protein